MQRVWTALLLLLTAGVVAAVAYVFLQKTPVPNAGKALGDPTGSATPPTSLPTSGAPTSSGTPRVVVNKIAFLGDDYTLGVGGTEAATPWTKQVATALHAKHFKAFGEDGAGYAKTSPNGNTYGSLVDQVVAYRPDVVVVTGGRNDAVDDPSTLTRDAADVFARLRSGLPKNARIFAVKPFWGDSDHPDKLKPVDEAVKAGVLAAKGDFLGINDPLHGHSDYMADEAHPNDKGYAAIAKAVANRLKRRLGH